MPPLNIGNPALALLALLCAGCAGGVGPGTIPMLSLDDSPSLRGDWLYRNVRDGSRLALAANAGSKLGMGVASALLLARDDHQLTASQTDHIEAWMPAAQAADEEDAKLKMSRTLSDAVERTLTGPYRTRWEEFEDVADFGSKYKTRFLRVDGPGCEDWSCYAGGSFPSETALQDHGDMALYDVRVDKGNIQCPCYVYYDYLAGVHFRKITREHVEKGSLKGLWHRMETTRAPFADEAFYLRYSSNLPPWVYLYFAEPPEGTDMAVPALLNEGRRVR